MEDIEQNWWLQRSERAVILREFVRSAVRFPDLSGDACPEMGRPVDDMEPEYREWLIDFGDSGYVALYHYDGTTAIIVAVRHQRESGYF